MKKPSDLAFIDPEELRAKIIGLGERSARKSYYPELRARIAELERFRAALDESYDAILLAELPGGQLHDVNKTACRMLGVSGADLLGRSLGEIVPALRGSLERARDLADGYREHDITERRRADAERELLLARERAARVEAERANRIKDEFVATVSHEPAHFLW